MAVRRQSLNVDFGYVQFVRYIIGVLNRWRLWQPLTKRCLFAQHLRQRGVAVLTGYAAWPSVACVQALPECVYHTDLYMYRFFFFFWAGWRRCCVVGKLIIAGIARKEIERDKEIHTICKFGSGVVFVRNTSGKWTQKINFSFFILKKNCLCVNILKIYS